MVAALAKAAEEAEAAVEASGPEAARRRPPIRVQVTASRVSRVRRVGKRGLRSIGSAFPERCGPIRRAAAGDPHRARDLCRLRPRSLPRAGRVMSEAQRRSAPAERRSTSFARSTPVEGE